ncbi:DUF91 domain-containing protein [Candidatus Saccharibacteria bacterium]|nr:DUF91 domain-containing protein [Candidatus Saccharibacteria bacterium]
MPSIIISKNGKNAKKIEKTEFASESVLQEYIYNNPESIPIDEIEDGLRLFVAAREFQVGSGRIDALGFDQHGNIYVIETKLARNADKRTVVAQVLDYGAYLWSSQDAEDFLNEVSSYTQQSLAKDFQTALMEYFELDDVMDVINNIKDNLASGNIRFIVMMDEIEPHLKDMVRFINQNSKYDVYAVETSFYKSDDQEIMTAEMFGDEVKKEMGVKAKVGTFWDKSTETNFVRSVYESDLEVGRKEQIMKMLGILKNVAKKTANECLYWHVSGLKLNEQRLGSKVFYYNDDGSINVFINGPSGKKYKDAAEFFRRVYEEMKENKVFSVEGSERLTQFWPVPSNCTDVEYEAFVKIVEDVAREKGYIEKYSENNLREFVDSNEWTFAKTYAETAPHEYIIVKPDDPKRNNYLNALKFIFENGFQESFYDKVYTRYILDGKKYWPMEQSFDDVDSETIVLNRTRPENTYTMYE